MNLTCPACNQPISLPDSAAGRIVACPACKQNFAAPHVAPGGAGGGDELALQLEQPADAGPQGPPDLSTIQFCPKCGANWKKNSRECGKCHYDAILGAVLKPQLKTRRSFHIDFQKVFLYVALGGLAFGAYWLYNNFSSLKRKGDAMYDNATRQEPSADQDSPMVQKGARSKD